MSVEIGQVYVPRCEYRRAQYERQHGGPMRLVVREVGGESPWDRVVLARYTGAVSMGRTMRLAAFRLLDDYEVEA